MCIEKFVRKLFKVFFLEEMGKEGTGHEKKNIKNNMEITKNCNVGRGNFRNSLVVNIPLFLFPFPHFFSCLFFFFSFRRGLPVNFRLKRLRVLFDEVKKKYQWGRKAGKKKSFKNYNKVNGTWCGAFRIRFSLFFFFFFY